jgi:hypothetical protein
MDLAIWPTCARDWEETACVRVWVGRRRTVRRQLVTAQLILRERAEDGWRGVVGGLLGLRVGREEGIVGRLPLLLAISAQML